MDGLIVKKLHGDHSCDVTLSTRLDQISKPDSDYESGFAFEPLVFLRLVQKDG